MKKNLKSINLKAIKKLPKVQCSKIKGGDLRKDSNDDAGIQ